MSTDKKPKTISVNVTNGGMSLLKLLLGGSAWYEGATKVVIYGIMDMRDKLDDYEVKEGDVDWAMEEVKVDLSRAEFDACALCIKAHVQKAAIGLTKHVRSLMDEFEVEI